MATVTNTGSLYQNGTATTPLVTANANVVTYESGAITMTKVANNPGVTYFSGDPITYTITINNTSTSAINGLVFKDTIPSAIIPQSGSNFVVTASSGTVSSSANPVTVTGINIPASGNATITIAGKVA